MNTDFRVSVDYFEHHKTKKLVKRLGVEGSFCHLKLLAYAAKHRPEGVFTGMDGEDIEIAAGWKGEDGALASTLCDLSLLEQCEEGVFSIHDWQDHNDWASEADARSDSARLSRLARVNKAAAEDLKADGRSGITKDEYKMYAEGTPYVRRTTNRSTPAPAPSPTPAPTPPTQEARGGVEEEIAASAPYESQDYAVSMDIQQIGEGYPPDKYDPGAAEDALKALVSKRQWPGLKRIQDDLTARCKCEQWTKDNGQFVPWLSNYLAKRTWMNKIPEARAAPPPSAYASAESKAIDDIANELRRKEQKHEHELPESHSGERLAGPQGSGPALPQVEAGRRAGPPGR
ncbi:MAG: hypothetical protein FD177_237 [Desulfovibrionaceae bacterium]|nr:MAG: hypothetical protein FD177_237 [Desulfovibrionaceae bacterium]